MTANEFILGNIDKTIRHYDDSRESTLLYTPYPYMTPCAEGIFQEMYYWDTYFTHKALFLCGKQEQVLNNIRNFDYLLKKYGKIPNGNREYYLNRSQPPFFGLMISDYIASGADGLTERKAFEMLEREYLFWMQVRKTANGLNRYSCDLDDEACVAHFGGTGESEYEKRIGVILDRTPEKCRSVLAECESGWDFSPRFHGDCLHFNPVDLNCLLYADEVLLSKWGESMGRGQYYADRAAKRKAAMDAYMLASNGIYYDYDFIDNRRSENLSCANFFPMFVGLSGDRNAAKKILGALERDHGIVAAVTNKRCYQWAEPNSWAPLTYIAVKSLDNIGLYDDALRIADKFVRSIDRIFKQTGRLWEKYNAETGALDVIAEYEQPEMLGWTAGVYTVLQNYVEKRAGGL